MPFYRLSWASLHFGVRDPLFTFVAYQIVTMKKLMFLLILFPFTLLAQPPAPTVKGFRIEGKLDDYADGLKVSLVQNATSKELASGKLLKGKFLLTGKVEEPELCYILIDGVEKSIEIFVENANITVKGKKGDTQYKIEGSVSHKDFAEFTAVFIPLYQQISSIVSTINSTPAGPDKDKLMSSYTAMHQNIQTAFDKYFREHSASYVAPFVLTVSLQFNDDVTVLERRFNGLAEKIRKSKGGAGIVSTIAEKKIGSIGSLAMDFSQPDTAGNLVTLSSFKGKYVLVDFWASWCGPCRNENPNVVENFNQFRTKNFTVLGVSLDRPGQKEKWLEAIHNDGLTWTHISDLQFWNNAVAKMYHISSIPQNLLVDPQGKIIGKNLRGPDLKAKLCEVLGCD